MNRRLPRFGLRTLLVIVTISALVVWWYARVNRFSELLDVRVSILSEGDAQGILAELSESSGIPIHVVTSQTNRQTFGLEATDVRAGYLLRSVTDREDMEYWITPFGVLVR